MVFRARATSKFPAVQSAQNPRTGKSTAETVLNIVRDVTDTSRMLQRLSIVMTEQKKKSRIVMNLHPVRHMKSPVKARISLIFEAPTKHFFLGEMVLGRETQE